MKKKILLFALLLIITFSFTTAAAKTDRTSPTITLIGSSYLELEFQQEYSELGMKVYDASNKEITVNIKGFVDVNKPGTYQILYLAKDVYGNTSTKTRTVIVKEPYVFVDIIPPVITINGEKEVSIYQNDEYLDLGATAIDETDGVVNVTTNNTVDSSVIGTYQVTYTAIDNSGNISTDFRTVHVLEVVIEPPIEDGIYLSSFNTISNSIQEFSGSMSAGSNILTLTTSTHDFQVGHGIAIQGAGSASDTNYWLISEISAVSSNKITLKNSASKSVSGVKILHDDTKAVNAVLAKGANTYFFDLQTINIKGLKLQSNSVYDGMNCTLNLPIIYSAPPYVQSMIDIDTKTNITFKNFNVDGGKIRGVSGNDQVGVALMMILDSSNLTINNNNFKNNGYVAIDLQSVNDKISILNNQIINTDVGVMGIPEWLGNLYLTNLIVKDNYIDGGTSEGVSILSSMRDNPGYAQYILIEGNTIKNKSANGIQIGGKTKDIVVKGNEISACGNGIAVMDPNLDKVAIESPNVDIINNYIYNVRYSHLYLDGDDVYVAYNILENGSDVFVSTGRYFVATDLIFEYNTLKNIGNTTAIAIYRADVARFSNNTFIPVPGSSGAAIGYATWYSGYYGYNLSIFNNILNGMRSL